MKRKVAQTAGKTGSVDDGEQFVMPATMSAVQRLCLPWNWSVGNVPALLFLFINIYLGFFSDLPMWVYVTVSLVFRAAYNVGLGALLHHQSLHKRITQFYTRWARHPNERLRKLLDGVVRSNMQSDFDPSKFPVALKAWLMFRHLVDTILANDVAALIALFLHCVRLPSWSDFGPALLLQYAAGLALVAFNYWAKVDAHRCIGDYCWYWGDFFFRLEQNLTFDGIFELFPHPMYTVGYAMYYGLALLSRSYTFFFVSLASHLLQLAFLVLVEEPHIQRLYGKPADGAEAQKVLSEEGLLKKRESVFVFGLDFLDAADVALAATMAYLCLSSWFMPQWLVWLQALVWRAVHWAFVFVVLYNQSKYRSWTKRFDSVSEAFSNWRRMFNFTSTASLVSFATAAFKFAFVHFERHGWSTSFAAGILLGLALVAVNVYSWRSAHASIGDFGWYYGDFFVPPDHTEKWRPQLCYTGVYRFLNNPECVTGYFGLYGLALLAQSYWILLLAILAHVANIVFVSVVENPHVRRLYAGRVRKEAPLPRAINHLISEVDRSGTLRAEVDRARSRAVGELLVVYKNVSDQLLKDSQSNKTNKSAVSISAVQEQVDLGETVEIKFEAPADHAAQCDWVALYPIGIATIFLVVLSLPMQRLRTSTGTPSAPGLSGGKWLGVPAGESGTLSFEDARLPHMPGVYEARYHLAGSYESVATCVIAVGLSSAISPVSSSEHHEESPSNDDSDSTEEEQEQ